MKGFESPNHTQTPNDLFDVYLPDMGYAELKVVMILIRETFGYHRTEKRLSIRKLAKKAGLSARNAYEGAQAAVKRGLFIAEQDGGVTKWSVVVRDTVLSQGIQSVVIRDTPSIKERDKERKIIGADAPNGDQPQPRKRTEKELVLEKLEQEFSRITGVAIPRRETDAQKKTAAVRWWNPLYAIYTDSADRDCDKAIRLMENAILKMNKDKLTISAPASIEQVVIALAASSIPKRTVIR